MEHYITEEMIKQFNMKLIQDERSAATIRKYMHDLQVFLEFLCERKTFTKETIIAYKQYLQEHYAVASVNSMLAAVNSFFKAMGWCDCLVRLLKVQRESFRERELTVDEYYRLLETAETRNNQRLRLVMETICSTGIRVSELAFITAESLHTRRATVSLKGKTRIVVLPKKLCRKLLMYTKKMNIKKGCVFVTRNGKSLDRSNILHDMKRLCEDAGVDSQKVFPHNLRHLFAVSYYKMQKDISHLADLLGHTNINTTRIYTLVNGEEQERQLDLMRLVV